ncbi:TIGR00266 family protein [Methanolacinia paynteri]|uniref:TIGR00266 family protein n=1 Tax=Methanolacinia paynteri TaxID=230356 RepID=UPI00064E4C98|nr:TIGR00266 family protein [Methanolacinia paynteri]
MKYSITGDNLQFVTMEIENAETVWAEAGAMVYMSANIDMKAELQGGLFKGIKRKLAGESFMITNFTSQGGPGVVAFGGNAPGKIYAMDITGKDFLAQKDAFLCAEKSVNWEIAFQKKLGSTFFGGEGLILEKISGSGMVFFHACGDLVEIDLKPGQTYKISTAHVVGWESSVNYDIQAAGGIKTSMFGGEGFFLTTLTGPGKIVIQSMTLPQLADSLIPFLPHSSNSSGGSGFEIGI